MASKGSKRGAVAGGAVGAVAATGNLKEANRYVSRASVEGRPNYMTAGEPVKSIGGTHMRDKKGNLRHRSQKEAAAHNKSVDKKFPHGGSYTEHEAISNLAKGHLHTGKAVGKIGAGVVAGVAVGTAAHMIQNRRSSHTGIDKK